MHLHVDLSFMTLYSKIENVSKTKEIKTPGLMELNNMYC